MLLLDSQRPSRSTSLVIFAIYLNGSSRQAVAPPLALHGHLTQSLEALIGPKVCPVTVLLAQRTQQAHLLFPLIGL